MAAPVLQREMHLPRPDRATLIALGGLAALAVLLLHEAVLGGRVLYTRDVSVCWTPQMESFVRSVHAGGFPLWDRWRGLGQPLLADPSSGVLYPPTWLNLVLRPWT